MSPAHLQQAQQAAAQVAARLGQPGGGGGGGYHQNSGTIPNPEAVQKAKELISKMIPQPNPMGGGPGGAGGGPAPNRAGLGSANNYEEIMIPGSKVGLIIGKGGETIKQLQERTGAKMVVVQDGPGQEMEKPLRISGDPQKVEHAKQLVFELIQDKGEGQQPNNRGGGGGGGGGSGGGGNYNNRHQDREHGSGGPHGGNGGGGGGGYGKFSYKILSDNITQAFNSVRWSTTRWRFNGDFRAETCCRSCDRKRGRHDKEDSSRNRLSLTIPSNQE